MGRPTDNAAATTKRPRDNDISDRARCARDTANCPQAAVLLVRRECRDDPLDLVELAVHVYPIGHHTAQRDRRDASVVSYLDRCVRHF